MERTKRGVFCIESVEGVESFEPTLRLLSKHLDFSILTKGVRRVRKRLELTKAIEEWGNRDDFKYPLLWMCGHGAKGGFYVDDPAGAGHRRLDVHTLVDMAADSEYGGWARCHIHFGACSTLADDKDARSVLEKSGLQGVSGYTKDVYWIPSLAFEVLYVQFLQEAMQRSYSEGGLDGDTLAKCRDRLFDSRMCAGLIDHLGFRLITRADFGLDG